MPFVWIYFRFNRLLLLIKNRHNLTSNIKSAGVVSKTLRRFVEDKSHVCVTIMILTVWLTYWVFKKHSCWLGWSVCQPCSVCRRLRYFVVQSVIKMGKCLSKSKSKSSDKKRESSTNGGPTMTSVLPASANNATNTDHAIHQRSRSPLAERSTAEVPQEREEDGEKEEQEAAHREWEMQEAAKRERIHSADGQSCHLRHNSAGHQRTAHNSEGQRSRHGSAGHIRSRHGSGNPTRGRHRSGGQLHIDELVRETLKLIRTLVDKWVLWQQSWE